MSRIRGLMLPVAGPQHAGDPALAAQFSLDFARRGDEALGTGGLLARLQPFVCSEAYPAWFRDWGEIEREAISLRWFEPLLIPGLLQAEGYARALLAAAGRPGR